MPFNISSFKSNLEKYGYLQNNKFEVYVRPPNVLVDKNILDLKNQQNKVKLIIILNEFNIYKYI